MDNNTKAKIRDLLPEYLEKYHKISRQKLDHGLFTCLNPEHADRHPSMSLDKKNMQCHCFGCEAKYDIFDVIGIDYNLTSFTEQADKAAELFGIQEKTTTIQANEKPKKNYAEYIRNCALNIEDPTAMDYLKQRGISTETAVRYAIGYDPSFKSSTGDRWTALIIPTGYDSESFTARNLSGQGNRYEKRGSANLFNARAITENTDAPLFVVEGELDALSVIEAGGNAVGLGSVANIAKFVIASDQISSDRLIILAMDNDDAGRTATESLEYELTQKDKHFISYNPYGDCKDANEALVTDRQSFIGKIMNVEKSINEERKTAYIQRESASGMISEFLGMIADNRSNKPISTGFTQFDKVLGGGLYKGLYVIGAISSLGKTTLVLQIADQIAANGQDVLIFSLEMGKHELIGKSISRCTLEIEMEKTGGRAYAKTYRDITDGSRYENYSDKEKRRIAEAVHRYKGYSDHLFIKEAVGEMTVNNIVAAVENHSEITGNYPVVIIDYLQVIKPLKDGMSDKQNADTNIKLLRQLARRFPVIAVSSVNRESYKEGSKSNQSAGTVSMTDLKESGGIEYGADTVIGLQFSSAGEMTRGEDGKWHSAYDERAAKKEDPRCITAVILKDRFGEVYGECNFNFIPQFNCFIEK